LITHHTFLDIEDAELIVADLTFLNANALYELGVAHARGKRVIHICSQDTILPFDIRDYRAVIFDPRDPASHEQAAADIERFAIAAMKESEPLNPYTAAVGRRAAIRTEDAGQKSLEQLYSDVDALKAKMDMLAQQTYIERDVGLDPAPVRRRPQPTSRIKVLSRDEAVKIYEKEYGVAASFDSKDPSRIIVAAPRDLWPRLPGTIGRFRIEFIPDREPGY